MEDRKKKEYLMHCPICGRDFNYHDLTLSQKITHFISFILMVLGIVFLSLLASGAISLGGR